MQTRGASSGRHRASTRSWTSRSTTRVLARSRSSWWPPAFATPTTTSPPATSRSVSTRSRAATRARASSPRRRRRTTRGSRRATTSSSRSCPPAGTAAGALRASRTSATSAPGCSRARGGRTRPTSGSSSPATDTPVGQMCGISTFVETTTVSADSAVKVDDDIPLDRSACSAAASARAGVPRSTPARCSRAHRRSSWASAGSASTPCRALRTPGASNIIAVDPVALKREKAQQLGATHGVETMEEATELAKQFTNGQGADQTIITVGIIKPEYVGQAMASIRKAGTVVVTALGNIADTTPAAGLAGRRHAVPEAHPGRRCSASPTRTGTSCASSSSTAAAC